MIDRSFIGHEFAPVTAEVEKGRLRFFAKATGNADPVYSDESAAAGEGIKNQNTPPPKKKNKGKGTAYHAPVCAGDSITLTSRITDIYDKKNGALEFIVMDSECRNQDGVHVADLRRSIVVRNA